ncbi:hypothetical protein BO70DRAFT_157288 [Aspergillus heteromorphus CBS 117.55]|uniref:Uncharacterized protein n=1 Tax=Aspergillus heteromorphus CBS 117.55 TaxID=1448321 RepID=A0A317WVQ2_9EURO|nr:uncharacterized protein BO70DRAFT_157288 [Aspergillus heteromorphus CBS 117.55]PWY88928.1 hypothetical protein BO70DRAFT_157288 [Aspergillus heteromorphus CBS 117.55]
MSVTIRSEIVDLELLVPRTVESEREDADVARLVPWVFCQTTIAEEGCTLDWPASEPRFEYLLHKLSTYRTEVPESERGISGAIQPSATITLPRKSWKLPRREYFKGFIGSQRSILYTLLNDVYSGLDGVREQGPRVRLELGWTKKYIIGGNRFAARSEGAAVVKVREMSVPIVSFTGWFEGQTWDQFLSETLSIMLGQLAKNTSILQREGRGPQDQETFVIGFHVPCFHVAYGLFPAATVARVHLQGFSLAEVFDLKFSRGYDLCLKDDWMQAMRVLARLFRYLVSGKAKVGALQALRGGSETGGNGSF